MSEPLQLATDATLSKHGLQVYAAYRHAPDVASGAAGPSVLARMRPLSDAEAASGAVAGASLQRPDMKQAVAWALAHRGLVHAQEQSAASAVSAATGASEVKDMHVTIKVHSRQAHLVMLPAYVAHYQYGTRHKQGTSGVIVPQVFTAIIGGTKEGTVSAPLHVSTAKATVGAGGLVGGLGLLAGDLAEPLLGLSGPLVSLGSVEAITLAVLAASGASMWASTLTQTQRAKQVAAQAAADYDFYKRYDQLEAQSPHHKATAAAADPLGEAGAAEASRRESSGTTNGGSGVDDHMLWLWQDADWRRWEADDAWNWRPEAKQKLAEDILRQSAVRRLERQRYVERRRREALRQAQEAEAEARRERFHGTSAGAQRPGGSAASSTYYAAGGRRDFLGYYRLLGLADQEEVTLESIKAAFKALALQHHPDRVSGEQEQVQREAHVRFQKLQIAYDTLKDPEKRRLYDRGQLVQ